MIEYFSKLLNPYQGLLALLAIISPIATFWVYRFFSRKFAEPKYYIVSIGRSLEIEKTKKHLLSRWPKEKHFSSPGDGKVSVFVRVIAKKPFSMKEFTIWPYAYRERALGYPHVSRCFKTAETENADIEILSVYRFREKRCIGEIKRDNDKTEKMFRGKLEEAHDFVRKTDFLVRVDLKIGVPNWSGLIAFETNNPHQNEREYFPLTVTLPPTP